MLDWQAGGPVWASSAWVCDFEWCLFVSAHAVFPLHPAEPKKSLRQSGQRLVSGPWDENLFLKRVNRCLPRDRPMSRSQYQSTYASLALLGCVMTPLRCPVSTDTSISSDGSSK